MSTYDPIDTCPYDPVHRIMRSRMQYHLTKCAKNWPCSKKLQCPYDARHVVNQIEFNYHVSVCPQRESVWRYKFVDNNDEVMQPRILPIDSTPAAAQSEENWEEEGRVKSYDPKKNTENRPVIRTLEGATKSERKSHQRQERLRLSRLEDVPTQKINQRPQCSVACSTSVQPTIPEEASADTELEYKPLRRPKKLPFDSSILSNFSTMNESAAVNQTQNSVYQNESIQLIKEDSNANEKSGEQVRKVFSYASALKHQQNRSLESDYDVIVESVKFDGEKENNSSFFNNTRDESLIKVTKTVEELTLKDEGHKRESESLDKTLESLKRTEKHISAIGNNFISEKRSSRCAANFTNSNSKLQK